MSINVTNEYKELVEALEKMALMLQNTLIKELHKRL
jgi:hypothetical protein